MQGKIFLPMLLYASLSSATISSSQNKPSNLSEHCFEISSRKTIAIEEATITPETFVRMHNNVDSAINGPYFGGKDPQQYKTQGIAYLADDHQFADGDLRQVRGFFTVSRNGREIKVSETLDAKMDYWLVIGTHPLLVVDGKTHAQSREPRYTDSYYRSAIGTKNGEVCFLVSEDEVTMRDWANRLQQAGYNAINLDGNTVSQMAERKDESVEVKGKGKANTRLIIFEQRR